MLERTPTARAHDPVPSFPHLSVTPNAEGVVLAFDFGTRRVGVAIGNSLTRVARPLASLQAQGTVLWASIEKQIGEWTPALIVVGIPRHPDGAAHEMTARAERFARQLEGRFRLPVARVDERYSTTAAAGADDVDAAAAAVILQQWFDGPIPTPNGAARGQARVVPAAPSECSAKPRLHPLEGEGENSRAVRANDDD